MRWLGAKFCDEFFFLFCESPLFKCHLYLIIDPSGEFIFCFCHLEKALFGKHMQSVVYPKFHAAAHRNCIS
jgi:hypothetical protein